MSSLRTAVDRLQEQARRRMELQHGIQVSVDNLPVLRDAVASLESRMSTAPAPASTEVSWGEVSERAASEMGRASEVWNERMISEVERAVQT